MRKRKEKRADDAVGRIRTEKHQTGQTLSITADDAHYNNRGKMKMLDCFLVVVVSKQVTSSRPGRN